MVLNMENKAKRQADYRARMREKGYKLKSVWVDKHGVQVTAPAHNYNRSFFNKIKDFFERRPGATKEKLRAAEAEIILLKKRIEELELGRNPKKRNTKGAQNGTKKNTAYGEGGDKPDGKRGKTGAVASKTKRGRVQGDQDLGPAGGGRHGAPAGRDNT
jgi:hypothetical protein